MFYFTSLRWAANLIRRWPLLIPQFVDLLQLRSAKWQRWERLLSGRYRPFAVGDDRPISCSPIESLNCRLTRNTHSIGIGVAAQSRNELPRGKPPGIERPNRKTSRGKPRGIEPDEINRGLSPIVPIVSGSAWPRLVSSGLAQIEPEQLLLETVGPHHAVGVAVAR